MKFITRRRTLSRPILTTSGLLFLNTPRFVLSHDTPLVFIWSIKGVGSIPALSLRISKITYGKGGRQVPTDCTENFIFPEIQTFPETHAEENSRSKVVIQTEYVIRLKHTEGLRTGVQFRILIEMKISGKEIPLISQNFIFIKGEE